MKHEQRTAAVRALIAHFGGRQADAAKAVGVKQPTISAWLNQGHGVHPVTALRIETITGGAIKAVDLCPELAETKAIAS